MASHFEIREPRLIPFFDHDEKSLWHTIRNSGKRRQMNPLHFAFRKMRNIILFRLSFFCPLNSWRVRMHRWRGIHIGKHVYVGQLCVLDNAYPEYIYIEDHASMVGEVSVIAHVNPCEYFSFMLEAKVAPVVIKEGAWIGIRSVILPGVSIGMKSIVSAGTVVDCDVPDYTLVQGNPMKKVTTYKKLSDIYERNRSLDQ